MCACSDARSRNPLPRPQQGRLLLDDAPVLSDELEVRGVLRGLRRASARGLPVAVFQDNADRLGAPLAQVLDCSSAESGVRL